MQPNPAFDIAKQFAAIPNDGPRPQPTNINQLDSLQQTELSREESTKTTTKISEVKSPLMKLPNYYKSFSRTRGNGVFLLSNRGKWSAHDNKPGPVGWNFNDFPIGGAPFEGLNGFANVWDAGLAFITYAEGAPDTEQAWLDLVAHPVAERTISDFFIKLLEVAKNNPNAKYKKAAQTVIDDIGLEPSFYVNMAKRAKGRRLNPEDESVLAHILNNPKRPYTL